MNTLGHLLALRVTPASDDDRSTVTALAEAVQDGRDESVTLSNTPGPSRPTQPSTLRPSSHEPDAAFAFGGGVPRWINTNLAGAVLAPHTHQSGLSLWSCAATVAVVEAASGLVFGFDEPLKHGGRQGFWLARRMLGGWAVRAPEADCAGGDRAEGWFPQLSRDERRALCRTSRFEPPAGPGDPK